MCGGDGMIDEPGLKGREQTRWTDNAYVALHACQDQAAVAPNEISKCRCRSLPAVGRQAGCGWGTNAVFGAATLR